MGAVSSLAISPDGKLLASGGSDRAVRLWSLPEGKLLKSLVGQAGAVYALAISPDGKLLATGGVGVGNAIKLWSLPDGALVRTLDGNTRTVYSLAISPDGTLLASGGVGGTVNLWMLPDGRLLKTLEGTLEGNTNVIRNLVRAVAISRDGRLLVSGSADRTVKVWSLPDGRLVNSFDANSGVLEALAISPDGKLLASGSTLGPLQLRSLPDGSLVRTFEDQASPVYALAISPDGSLLVSGGVVRSPAASRTGNLSSLGGLAGTVKIWSLVQGQSSIPLTGLAARQQEPATIRQQSAAPTDRTDSSASSPPRLIYDLLGGSEPSRQRAAQTLGRVGGPQAVEALIKALGDTEASVRGSAAEALGALGDVRAVEPLLHVWESDTLAVRTNAEAALIKIGSASVPPLLAIVSDHYSGFRVQAAALLGRVGDRSAVKPLLATLPEVGMRSVSATALESLGEPLGKGLLGVLEGQPGALDELAVNKDARMTALLLVVLGEQDSKSRGDAAAALGKLPQCTSGRTV